MVSRHLGTPIMHRLVEVNSTVYMGGVTAESTVSDIHAQTESVLTKMEGYLREIGLDRKSIVSTTVYLSNFEDKAGMNKAWVEFFGEHLPTRATIGVSNLGQGVLIEVVGIASRE